jgi:hypothetical protein
MQNRENITLALLEETINDLVRDVLLGVHIIIHTEAKLENMCGSVLPTPSPIGGYCYLP